MAFKTTGKISDWEQFNNGLESLPNDIARLLESVKQVQTPKDPSSYRWAKFQTVKLQRLQKLIGYWELGLRMSGELSSYEESLSRKTNYLETMTRIQERAMQASKSSSNPKSKDTSTLAKHFK